jgi:hypothetical protein
MSTRVKSIRRNVLPATACASGSTTTSTVQKDWLGAGIRFYVTISGVTATGTTDTFYLCAQAPAGGSAFPLVGFSGANMLSVAGTWTVEFYPGAWLPSGTATGTKSLGVAGIHVPLNWAAQVLMGSGNAATITVDAETLP